jgi:hypothetical protein
MSKMYIFIRQLGKYFLIPLMYTFPKVNQKITPVTNDVLILYDAILVSIIKGIIQSSKDNSGAMEANLEPWRHPGAKEAPWSQGGTLEP